MEFSKDAINQFVESNLSNFSINGSGWHSLIRDMLYEFCIAGWNLDEKVFGKEKFGGLRCYVSSPDEALNKKIQEIKSKYIRLSGKTCEKCGKEGKGRFVNSWETTLCFDHYFETINILEIDNDDDVKINGKYVFNTNEISRIEIRNSYRQITLYISSSFTDKEKTFHFARWEPNFYLLLNSIPQHLFSNEDKTYIKSMFQNLKDCEICGYKSVFENRCVRCLKESWNNSLLEYYDNKLEYIKEIQMDLFIDEDNDEKVRQFDRSFEKLPDHKFIFNDEELKKYKKELQEMDL